MYRRGTGRRRESRPPTQIRTEHSNHQTLVMNKKMNIDLDAKEDFTDSSLSAITRYSILLDQWSYLAYGFQNRLIGRDEMTQKVEELMESLDIPPLYGCAFLQGVRETLKEDNKEGLQLENGLVLNL